MRMTDISASKRGHGLGCIEETFSQVHGNVTQPSRPAFDKIASWTLILKWALEKHRLWLKQCKMFVWSCANMTKTTYSRKKYSFPYFPNLSIQVLSCPYSKRVGCACLYPDVSCRRKPGWGPRRAAPTADSLIPAAAPTHSLRGNFVKSVQMSGLEDLGPLPEGWSLKWHVAGDTRRPWVMKYSVFLKILILFRYFVNHHTRQTTWDDPRKQR